MQRPFELSADELEARLDEMVTVTFNDVQSQFLVLPRGSSLIPFEDFQSAYEVLKRHTSAFAVFTEPVLWAALEEDSLALVVLRTILGLSPPEWADLAKSERGVDVPQGPARVLDVKVRRNRTHVARLRRFPQRIGYKRVEAMLSVAIEYITRGAPKAASTDTAHRLDKIDTAEGLVSLQHAAAMHVPYAALLYERYLGRPFASHRDSVSELVGDLMEGAVDECLGRAQITHRRTKRAERIPGFAQAADFFIPTEFAPAVVIEAKITGDDGTARDKVARILRLAAIRDAKIAAGEPSFELIACIDGRGFGIRRQDMKDILLATNGKVFTLNTLDRLIEHSRLHEFLPSTPSGT
jgi:hypothetical protein